MKSEDSARSDAGVERGAVLYDTRDPERRPCCSEGGRCLWHVTSVYEDADTGHRLYEVWDGTHTVHEYVHGENLLYPGMFTPAGWQCDAGTKPTYVLTRTHRVRDNHDLMLEANR